MRRIMARDGIDERYARMRISAQKSDEFYRGKCDYELSNTAETPEDFREIARDFFRRLIGELREEPAGKRQTGAASGYPALPSRRIYHFIDSLEGGYYV